MSWGRTPVLRGSSRTRPSHTGHALAGADTGRLAPVTHGLWIRGHIILIRLQCVWDQKSAMKRAISNVVVVVLCVALLATAWTAIRIERQATHDEAHRADIILVLGAAEYRGRPSPVLKARLDHALELYRKGLAQRLMTTGGAGGDPVFTEGEVGRDYLASQGVPPEDIAVEGEGSSTVASTALAGEIMRRMGLQSVIVVSDGYHIYRVKKMLEGRGLTVYGSPRPERARESLAYRLNYVKQAVGYLLWSCGVPV